MCLCHVSGARVCVAMKAASASRPSIRLPGVPKSGGLRMSKAPSSVKQSTHSASSP